MGGKKSFCFAIIIILSFLNNIALFAEYLEIKPLKGEGIYSLLKKYELPLDSSYFNKFIELNPNKISKNYKLFANYSYKLPILIYKYNGKNIRTTTGIDNYELAQEIQKWNKKLTDKKIKKEDYKISKELWVPFHYIKSQSKLNENVAENEATNIITPEIVGKQSKGELNLLQIFGKKYSKIAKIDNALSSYIYYIDPGHGGPDPGAIGHKNGYELDEDEYAYDVSLRLARNLMQHGAEVYFFFFQAEDGIRDDKFLKNSSNEVFGNGEEISGNARDRLQARIDYINEIYSKKKNKQHRLIVLHVDSRQEGQKIDIFFYHQPGDNISCNYASLLLKTIENKYLINQPQRGYQGTLTERNLFMLRHAPCTAVYIELGNIQNPQDQIRLIEPNNRQAIANWLSLGILKADGKIKKSNK